MPPAANPPPPRFDPPCPIRYKSLADPTRRAEANLPKVMFLNELVTVEAKVGQTLLEVADENGIELFRGIWPGLHCGRVLGWCNRCKLWATGATPEALNPRTGKEKTSLRLNGALPKEGTMRLACQAVVSGDVEVRTRSGFIQKQSLTWEPDPRHFKWQDRWAHRNDEPDPDEKAEKAAKAKAAAPAKAAKAAPAAAQPAEAAPAAAPATVADDAGGGDTGGTPG